MNKLEIQLTELRKIQVRFDKQENGEVKEIHIRDEDEDIITENGELLPLEFYNCKKLKLSLKFALQRIDIVNVDSLLDLFYKCCSHHSFHPFLLPTINSSLNTLRIITSELMVGVFVQVSNLVQISYYTSVVLLSHMQNFVYWS